MASPTDSLCSKVRLTLSAKNLKNCDVFSKSDPVCVVFLSSGALRDDCYYECGRTETLMNCLNPEWSKTICVDYFFEELQKVKFEVYDIDSVSNDLKEHDFIGFVETTLAEIVASPSSRKTFVLSGKEGNTHNGDLTVVAEEADSDRKEAVVFAIRAVKVDKKQFLGKSDPFLQIYRINDDGTSQLVHRTETISRTLNPTWKPFELSMQQLCGQNKNRNIRLDCYSYNKGSSGNHSFIGCCEVDLNSLIGKNDLEFALINEKKRKKKASKYVNSGRLIFMSVTTHRNFSFIEYITGGTQLDFTVAIDMTASNGNVTDPNSLHFIGGSQPNEYYIAIRSVADICQFYNNSNTFDAMGFGAKIPPQNFVNHSFPLNIGSNSYTVFGVPGLLEAYQRCLNSCILYGPTCFAPIISEASKKASSYRRDGSRYQILLIITDGCILDYDETLSAIIAASYLPMSIIIIGVGGENFDNMVKLDCDDGILSFQGRKAQRDIVQFVPLRQFLSNRGLPSMQSISGMHASAQLAKEVLAEIPDQLTKYMKLNDIQPRPASNPFPVSVPTPYHNPVVPTANIGVKGVQTSFGWAIPKPSEQIGMGGGGYSPSQFPSTAPYPTTPSLPQYPAHVPSASTAPPYPTKPLNIEFMKSSFDSGSMQPEPPPYQDTSRIPFGQTYVNVHPPNRPQPSAPPPP